MKFRLIFVMDLLDGVVVHAKRGERDKYEPISHFSSVADTSDPARMIEAIKPKEVYIADLNNLMGRGTNKELLKVIRATNRRMRVTVEYGIKSIEDVRDIANGKIANNIILGTETASLNVIAEASTSDFGCDVSVSVDLYNNKVLTRDQKMMVDPLVLISTLNNYPIQDVIVLELDRVGTKSGINVDFLARAVELSEHDILCGGGVRNCEDIAMMKDRGVKGALVATAVHDGSIPVFYL
jgi:phosphoribosylformimino-5-aminoimidazole carboxamide ribotide isomerase